MCWHKILSTKQTPTMVFISVNCYVSLQTFKTNCNNCVFAPDFAFGNNFILLCNLSITERGCILISFKMPLIYCCQQQTKRTTHQVFLIYSLSLDGCLWYSFAVANDYGHDNMELNNNQQSQ